MKVDRLFAASALLLVGVTAFAANVVVGRRAARARRALPAPEIEAPPRFALRPVFVPPDPPPEAPAPEAPAPATASLRFRVTGPHGLLLRGASAVVSMPVERDGDGDAGGDSGEDLEANEDEAGLLAATDLAPGRYDVVVSAPGMRAAKLTAVPTGDEVVEVSLARAPVLLGALGMADGRGCAGATIVVRGAGDDDDESTVDARLDVADCTFVVEDLPERGPLTVEARRGAAVERALVTLPSVGDPAAVCLMPPCAAAPASLAVYVADAAGHQLDGAALVWTIGDELNGQLGSTSSVEALSYLHDNHVGETYHLEVTASDHVAEASGLVGPGVTEVVLTLPFDARASDVPRPARLIRLDDDFTGTRASDALMR